MYFTFTGINVRGFIYCAIIIMAAITPQPALATFCGDGEPDSGEQCDDGNLAAGDGCSATCTVEAGFVCTLAIGIPLTPSACVTDSDADGVGDDVDNCTLVANPNQRDTDGDGHGNICDPDLTNDCVVNFLDVAALQTVFFTSDADADFEGDGFVNAVDMGVMRQFLFAPPGPSAFSSCNQPG